MDTNFPEEPNIFHRGEILYGKLRPYLNKVHLAYNDGVCSTDIYVLRPCNDQIHASYAAYYLRSPSVLTVVSSAMAGANLPRIGQDALLDISIPVPPLVEQERIVKLLDEADALRKLRAQADQRSEALIPALFHEMFGDPSKESKKWSMSTLGQLCDFVGGASLPQGRPFTGQLNGLLLLKVGDMNEAGNQTFISTCREWVDLDIKTHSRAAKGTVIIPKRGGAIATNKKRMLMRDALLDPNLMGIHANDDKLCLDYLFEWFRQFDLTRITSGSAVPQLNKQDLAPIRIAVPPLALQMEFSQRVTEIRDLEASQATSRTRLNTLFHSLLHRAFNEQL